MSDPCCCNPQRDYCITQGEIVLFEEFTSVRGVIGEWAVGWFTVTGGFDVASVTLDEVMLADFPDVEAVWPESPAPVDVWRVHVASTPAESRAVTPDVYPFSLRLVHPSQEPVLLAGTVRVDPELTV